MKVAVISDSHDNMRNMKGAISRILEEEVGLVIHCGDLCAPFMMGFLEEFRVPVHLVFGNVDGDRFRMLQRKPENLHMDGDFAELDLHTKKVFVVHYPEIARPIAVSGQYDLVCHGHSHIAKIERIGRALLVNPGEITDYKGTPSYAIVDLERLEAAVKPLE